MSTTTATITTPANGTDRSATTAFRVVDDAGYGREWTYTAEPFEAEPGRWAIEVTEITYDLTPTATTNRNRDTYFWGDDNADERPTASDLLDAVRDIDVDDIVETFAQRHLGA